MSVSSVPTILKYLNTSNNFNIMEADQNLDAPARAKKRRLDHLSWEEKMQRKKLKNRVAAQTSRDRKKAKMEQMENALQDLFTRNEMILAECESLKEMNEKLRLENADLYNKLKVSPSSCCSCAQNRSVECDVQQGSAESDPLQQGLHRHSAAALSRQTTMAIWKIVLAYLLYQTCSMNSTQTLTSAPWNNLRKVCCRTSPETWRWLLKRQIAKNQKLVNQTVLQQQQKWWGRHQNSWNPVDVKA